MTQARPDAQLAPPQLAPPQLAPHVAARREPVQRRSRERVERILDAAADLVTDHGVAELTTRAIAARTGVPVASIYQYYADKDEIVLALVARDTQEMDSRVAEAVGALRTLSIRSIVEATMLAFVSVCRRRPSFVVIWGRGRTNAAVVEFCRTHNRRVANDLHSIAVSAGLLRPEVKPLISELAVALGDRVIEMAFADDLRGNEEIIRAGIELLIGSLEQYATPAGLAGVPNPS
jgi:AcrR family transcriptional regulator